MLERKYVVLGVIFAMLIGGIIILNNWVEKQFSAVSVDPSPRASIVAQKKNKAAVLPVTQTLKEVSNKKSGLNMEEPVYGPDVVLDR